MSVNKVILIGRLTKDPEVKDVKGTQIVNFCLVTSKQWKDDSGEKQEKAEFHNLVAFRKTAELVGKYLKKGSQCYIEGELQTRNWEDDSGTKKYKTEIIANSIQFLGRANETESRDTDEPVVPKQTAPKKPVKNYAPGADNSALDDTGF